MRRSVALVAVSGCALAVASCGTIAGLGDYELAAQDAAAGDAVSESSAGDVAQGGGDGGAGSDAIDASASAEADAGAVVDSPGDAMGEDGAVEAAVDAPAVPPSDKSHVPCGSDKCNVPSEACCEEADASACQQANGGNCSGVVARCDEAANCPQGQVCCVTSQSHSGLETECRQSCQGGNPQSCRSDGECGGMGPCVAWTCAGNVVATCQAAGAASGCP